MRHKNSAEAQQTNNFSSDPPQLEASQTTQSLDSNDAIRLPKKPQIKKRVTLR